LRCSNLSIQILALNDTEHCLTGELTPNDNVKLPTLPKAINQKFAMGHGRGGVDSRLNLRDESLEGVTGCRHALRLT
ncbi:MAG: hypothetical protein FD135_5132, partial [Comamonadaceae bacterium]